MSAVNIGPINSIHGPGDHPTATRQGSYDAEYAKGALSGLSQRLSGDTTSQPEEDKVKIVYVGFSKCGTKTMAEAFRILGYKVCDYEETIMDVIHLWNRYLQPDVTRYQKQAILRQILEQFDVFIDIPYYIFWREILDLYPKTKFVFYEREENAWYKSFEFQVRDMMKQLQGRKPDWLINMVAAVLFPKLWKVQYEFRDLTNVFLFGRKIEYGVNWRGKHFDIDEVITKRLYRQHNADIRVNCPRKNTLHLNEINCGWGRLCNFLGTQAPRLHWPHMNKKGSLTYDLYLNPEARFPKALKKEMFNRLKVYSGILYVIVVAVFLRTFFF